MEVIYDVKVNTEDSVDNMKKLDSAVEGTAESFDGLESSTDKYIQRLQEISNEIKAADGDLEKIRQSIEDYKSVAVAAGEESLISSFAIEKAAELQNKINNVSSSVKALSQDGQNLDAALQLGETVTAGYQGFLGVTALISDENENLLEVITQLQAAQGIFNSIQTVRNALEKESILMLKAKSVQESIQVAWTNAKTVATNLFNGSLKIQTIMTNGAAVAQRALNVVMSMNPIGLLIAGIVALVGAFALFDTAAADAKDAQLELEDAINETNEAIERQNAILDANLADQKKKLDNTNKLIDAEIKYLQSIKNRSSEEEATLQKKLAERQANEIKGIDLALDNTEKKTKNFASSFELQFKAIENAIKITDIEDGINNISYSKVKNEVASFKAKLDEVLKSDIGTEEKIAKLQKLEKQYASVTRKLNGFNRELGSAEQEEFGKVISGFGQVGKVLTSNTNSLREQNNLIQDKENTKSLQEIEAATKRQEEAERRLEKQRQANAKAEAERKRKAEEAERERQRLIAENLAFAQRTEDIRISLIEDSYERELELLDTAFERELNKIKSNSEEANALREQLFLEFAAKEDEINKRRQETIEQKEREHLQVIAEIRNELTLDNDEKELLDFKTKQDAQLEQLRKGLESGLITKEEFDELKLLQEEQYNEKVREMNQKTAEEEQKAAKETHDKKIALVNEYVNRTALFLNNLSALNDMVTETQLNNAEGNEERQQQIRKKSFERNKKLQIAQAIIQGIQATQAALSSGLAIPVIGPIMGPLFAAGAAGMALANVNRIRSMNFNGGGGGGGVSASSAGGSSVGASAADLGVADTSDIRTDINADGSVNKTQGPIEVFVLESAITGTQTKVKESNNRATA